MNRGSQNDSDEAALEEGSGTEEAGIMADTDEADIVDEAVTYNGWYGASRHRGRGWQLREPVTQVDIGSAKEKLTWCLREIKTSGVYLVS